MPFQSCDVLHLAENGYSIKMNWLYKSDILVVTISCLYPVWGGAIIGYSIMSETRFNVNAILALIYLIIYDALLAFYANFIIMTWHFIYTGR